MPFLDQLAVELCPAAELAQAARLRLFDTALAWRASAAGELAGRFGRPLRALHGPLSARRASPAGRLAELAARGRSTEVDDIHLASCTTPGSAVCATVVALAGLVPEASAEQVLSAVAAGYEAMARAAAALGGPLLLAAGTWPSRAVAPVAAAATACSLLGLSEQEARQALALAAAWRCGGRAPEPARELSFAGAVLAGAAAALAVADGARGDAAALEEWESQAAPGSPLASGSGGGGGAAAGGGRAAVIETSLKPHCGARQTLAAVSALLELAGAASIAPAEATERVEAVRIGLPALHLRMVGREEAPGERLEAISSMRYQAALALARPAELDDLVRRPLHDPALVALMRRVELHADEQLLEGFPASWGASVELVAGGSSSRRRVEGVAGEHSLEWRFVEAKGARLFERAGVPGAELAPLAALCAGFERAGELDALLEAGLLAADSTTGAGP